MKRLLAAVAALFLASGPVLADGLFPGLPIEGGASYCAGTNVGSALSASQCAPTVPAGQVTPTGQAYLPLDEYGMFQATNSAGVFPQTGGVSATAFTFGPTVINSTAGSIVIPNNTPNFVENVGNTSATITLPAAPQPWQVQTIAIATAQTTSFLVGASAGQTCVPACPFTSSVVAAGTVIRFQYNASTAQWVLH
jgi:hypothetical protein